VQRARARNDVCAVCAKPNDRVPIGPGLKAMRGQIQVTGDFR
jgi:hypothetical protein